MFVYIIVFSIVSFFICRKNFDLCTWACCFFLLLSGLGFNINDEYRMGNIMISDIGLAILSISMIISGDYFKIEMKKNQSIMFIFLFLYTLLGIVNPIAGIIRDIKNYLYFMIPAFYFSKIKNDFSKLKCIMWTFIISEFYTLYLCLNEFFFVQGIAMYEDDIKKFYGLGLGADFLFYAAILLYINRNHVISKFGTILWTVLELLFIFGAFCSFVRSTWIVMITVTVVGFIVFLGSKKEYIVSKLNVFRSFIAIFMTFFLVWVVLKKIDVDIVEITKSRFSSIHIVNIDQEDTLAARLNDIYANKDRFFNPMIVIGYGMGGLMNNAKRTLEGNGSENSFMYYCIKFGLIGFFYLCYNVICYLHKKISSCFRNNQMTGVFLFIAMIVEAMSGNLNKYYISPFIMLLMIVDVEDLVKSIMCSGIERDLNNE